MGRGKGGNGGAIHVLSGAVVGVECVLVRVEVSVSTGLPALFVVGLPQGAVREGKDRVRAALQAGGFALPPRRIIVNLAPADLRKEGSGFDLALAVGLLAATAQVPAEAVRGVALLGELGLGGELRPVRGVLAMAAACRRAGVRSLFVPAQNAAEGASGAGVAGEPTVGGEEAPLEVHGARSLAEVVDHLRGGRRLPPAHAGGGGDRLAPEGVEDLSEVRGQPVARRALEIAAAGGHHLLMVGPPGSGKTMLARRLRGILPPLTPAEALEVTTIHSVAGLLPSGEGLVRTRPFRGPHHTVTPAGLIGGGSPVRPGELGLAHHGVLFLDELPEFPRQVLETLRQPLEEGWVSVVRARERVRFPARVLLVAAMNPCPCGYLGDPRRPCTCDPAVVARYRSRVSGTLLDRIDLRIEVPAVPYRELVAGVAGESSAAVRRRVLRARDAQWERQGGGARPDVRKGAEVRPVPLVRNAALSSGEVRRWCRPDRAGERLLEEAADRVGLTARGVHRVLKVARTIADLDGEATIRDEHVAEAIQYRG